LSAAAAGLLLALAPASAGPITPPAGPVAPTHKTLTQIEPRIPLSPETVPGSGVAHYLITQPGSYYLTGDVAPADSRFGIYIDAPDVTIDLNGFTMRGNVNSPSAISLSGNARNVVVRNGTITGWNTGIAGALSQNACFERLIIENIRTIGISAGSFSTVTDCIVRSCQSDGILIGGPGTVTRCLVSGCSSGIVVTGAGMVTDSSVQNNVVHGISVGQHSLVRGNHCVANGNNNPNGAGIHTAAQFCRIEGNSVVQNGRGISVTGTRNVIISNSAAFNATNFNIGPTNTVGPITSDLASASAWANIQH